MNKKFLIPLKLSIFTPYWMLIAYYVHKLHDAAAWRMTWIMKQSWRFLSIRFTELELLRSQATCWSLPLKVAGQGGKWAGGKVYMMDCSSSKSVPHCSASFVFQITLSKQPAVLGSCSDLKQIFDCKLMHMLGETKLLPQMNYDHPGKSK